MSRVIAVKRGFLELLIAALAPVDPERLKRTRIERIGPEITSLYQDKEFNQLRVENFGEYGAKFMLAPHEVAALGKDYGFKLADLEERGKVYPRFAKDGTKWYHVSFFVKYVRDSSMLFDYP
ncbi:MAG: hypothetical protein QW331_04075 [Candidatus Woesearchaeota archaeon]